MEEQNMKRYFALLLMFCMFISLPVYASAVNSWRDWLDEWNSNSWEAAHVPLKPIASKNTVIVYDIPGDELMLGDTITAEELSQCSVEYIGYVYDSVNILTNHHHKKYYFRIYNDNFNNNYLNNSAKFVAADSVEQVYEPMPRDCLVLRNCNWDEEVPSFAYDYKLCGDLYTELGFEIDEATARIVDMVSGEIVDSTTKTYNKRVSGIPTRLNVNDERAVVDLDEQLGLSSGLDFSQLTSDASYALEIFVKFTDPRHYYPEGTDGASENNPSHGMYSFDRRYFQEFKMKDSPHGDDLSVTATNLRVPTSTMTYGEKYSLKGTIAATGANLSQVSAYVYRAGDTSYSDPVTGTYENINKSSYSIYTSKLDRDCKFDTLEEGWYVYVLRALAGG